MLVSAACDRGNNKLMVGSIIGPTEITENSSAEYKVDAHSDTGITYSWISNPVGTGTFSSTDTASTIFTAPEVETDYPIVIRIIVNSDNDGPVIRSRDVIVLDVPDEEPDDDGDPEDDVDPPEPQNHPPNAAAHFEKDIIAGWHTFQFTDDSTDEDGDDDIVKWEWDFSYDEADGFNVESEEQNPEIRQYEVGFYPVMLRVTDSRGLSDMLDEPLLVEISEIATYSVSEQRRNPRIIELDIDTNGDVFLLGEANLEGSLNLEGYLEKYSKGESLEWTVIFDNNTPTDFTITDNDDFYICGKYITGYITHMDSDGNILNEITSEEITGDYYYQRGYYFMDTAPSGNIIVVDRIREYDGYWELDPWGQQIWHENWSENYYIIQEFTPDLELVKQSEPFSGYPIKLVVSDSGSIYTSGLTGLSKYNENMEKLWSTPTGMHGGNFVIDSEENAYYAGGVGGLLVKINSDGELEWKVDDGGFVLGSYTDIALYGNRLFLAGTLRVADDEEVDIDPGPGVQIHQLDSVDNTFVSIYNLDGVHEDSLVWSINYSQYSHYIEFAIDPAGNMFVARTINGVNDFDPGAGSNFINLGTNVQYYTTLWKIFPF